MESVNNVGDEDVDILKYLYGLHIEIQKLTARLNECYLNVNTNQSTNRQNSHLHHTSRSNETPTEQTQSSSTASSNESYQVALI